MRSFDSDPPNNSTYGTLDIRRTFKNESGGNLTGVRFRILSLSTFPASAGTADLRPRSSTAVIVTRNNQNGAGTENVTVQGTTLDQPPSQPNGGGFNSSLSLSSVSLDKPLAANATVDLRFLFGVQQAGAYQVYVEVEALPGGTRTIWGMYGHTEDLGSAVECAVKPSTTTLAASALNAQPGEPVTFTATSTVESTAAVGAVKFFVGAYEIGEVPLVAGKAQLTTSALEVGTHSITAQYLGGGHGGESTSSPIAVTIEAASGSSSSSTSGGSGGSGGRTPTPSRAMTDAAMAAKKKLSARTSSSVTSKERPTRVAAQIRQEAASFVSRELADPRLEGLVVTSVWLSNDLRLAKLFFRIATIATGAEHDAQKKAAQKGLERASGRLRKAITSRLGLRVAPELRFEYDEGQEKRDRIDRLLDEVARDRKGSS